MVSAFIKLLAGIALAAIFVVVSRLAEFDPHTTAAFFAGGMAGVLVEIIWRR